MLRADAKGQIPARGFPDPARKERWDRDLSHTIERDGGLLSHAIHAHSREEIHRRRADEARHKQIGGMIVELLRRTDLLDIARAEHREAISHRHRLRLVLWHGD